MFLGEGLPIHLIDYLTLGGGAMLAIYCANLAHPKISKYAAVKKGTIPTLIIAFFLSDMLRESSNSTIEVMPFMFGTSWALYMGFANIISLYRELLKTLVSSIK